MGYIDADFYSNVYGGTDIPADELLTLIERACELIDGVTQDKIFFCGGADNYFGKFPTGMQSALADAFKRAVAIEVEYLYLNGGVTAFFGGAMPGSVKIGDFSYSGGANAGNGDSRVCPSALDELSKTGLIYRGVSVCS